MRVQKWKGNMRTFGSISLSIPGLQLIWLCKRNFLLFSFFPGHCFQTMPNYWGSYFLPSRSRKNLGPLARTSKQAIRKELEHQRGLCEGNGLVVGPVRVYGVQCVQRTENERFLGVYERSLPWTKWGWCLLNSSIKVPTSVLWFPHREKCLMTKQLST